MRSSDVRAAGMTARGKATSRCGISRCSDSLAEVGAGGCSVSPPTTAHTSQTATRRICTVCFLAPRHGKESRVCGVVGDQRLRHVCATSFSGGRGRFGTLDLGPSVRIRTSAVRHRASRGGCLRSGLRHRGCAPGPGSLFTPLVEVGGLERDHVVKATLRRRSSSQTTCLGSNQ